MKINMEKYSPVYITMEDGTKLTIVDDGEQVRIMAAFCYIDIRPISCNHIQLVKKDLHVPNRIKERMPDKNV